jgi:hypothetical protein
MHITAEADGDGVLVMALVLATALAGDTRIGVGAVIMEVIRIGVGAVIMEVIRIVAEDPRRMLGIMPIEHSGLSNALKQQKNALPT